VFHTNAFIQLIITHKIKSSFISEMEERGKGKIAERQRERGRENEHWAAAGIVWVVKWTVRKYTCLINKMTNIWNNCY
jgi:hypothetical protein